MENPPEIRTILPRNSKIRKQVSYYYFLKDEATHGYVEFWHYPHYQATLNHFKHGQLVVEGNTRWVLPNRQNDFVSVYSSNTQGARRAILKKPYDVLGIVFNPLGINHFYPQTLMPTESPYWAEDWMSPSSPQLAEVFEAVDLQEKAQLLDELLEGLYQDFSAPILCGAIAQILCTHGDINLQELSAHLSVSRRTLLRAFTQHAGCSFSTFKSVVKFRTALHLGVDRKKTNKLSDLAYDAHYYDQSDFIKHFKIKTNETPRCMLSTVTKVTDQLLWKWA